MTKFNISVDVGADAKNGVPDDSVQVDTMRDDVSIVSRTTSHTEYYEEHQHPPRKRLRRQGRFDNAFILHCYKEGVEQTPDEAYEFALLNDRLYISSSEDEYGTEDYATDDSIVEYDSELELIYMSPQAGTETVSIMNMATTKEQNVAFGDKADEYMVMVDSEMDPTRMHQDTYDASLENFLSRPIKIFETEWEVGSSLIGNFDPWALFFNNKRVINRLNNYNLMRASLHLKFVINGNGFQYGRAFAAYLPFNDFDQATNTNELLAVRTNNVQLSQLPKIFLNPTLSMAGEMKLPFFFPKNSLKIPISEWSALGQILLRPLSNLKHANGASDKATVSVFAWAEDVQLSVLTSNDVNTLTPQSKVVYLSPQSEVEEANSKGFISGPATSLARMARGMAKAPLIGPYAKATADVAGASATLAKLFGMSRPPITKDPELLKPMHTSNLATTTSADSPIKLTVDDKQELSIDPRIAGLSGKDPMDILSIAERESYLTTFNWNVGVTPETLLWNTRVSPVSWGEFNFGSIRQLNFPACCAAALPFEKWTGTIKYRFQIVCSTFHKGRVRVIYDPNFVDENEYNTMYQEVIDIADKTDFTISVSNGQQDTWLEHLRPGVDSVTESYSTTKYSATDKGNGVLAMYVVNELTVPNSSINNDIEIHVFISAGDDFEVVQPSDDFQKYVYSPQSTMKEVNPDAEGTPDANIPEKEISSAIGANMDSLNNMACVFYGESIRSFRPLLKRYTLHEAVGTLNASRRVITGRRSNMPYYRGAVPGAVHERISGAATEPYNFCNTLLIHWVTMMHSGYRGSIRYKYMPRGPLDVNESVFQVERYDFSDGEPKFSQENFVVDNYTSQSDAARAAVIGNKVAVPYTRQSLTGANGMARSHSSVNPILEFEVPYYSANRFTPGKLLDQTSVTTNFNDAVGLNYRLFTGPTSNNTLFETYVAAGEDFQVYFFTGMPAMYYEAVPPSAPA